MKHSLHIIALSCIAFSMQAQHNAPTDTSDIHFGILGQDGGIIDAPTYEEYFNRGTDALRRGDLDTAIINLEKSKNDNNRVPQTHFNLGIAYEAQGKIDEAIEAFKDAILQRLDYPKAHHKLAKLLQRRGLLDQAIVHYEQAVQYDPSLIDAALTVARLLCEQERFEDSLEYFERYVKSKPNDLNVTFEYANALNTAQYTEQALEIYYALLRERPNESGILYNTAYTLKKLGRIKDAMPYYQAALKRNPRHAEAHFSLGLAHLVTGDFKQGWPEYEWRWQRNTQLSPRTFNQPQWDGSPLHGKTILLHAEQGLGDTFQFIRYAKVIKEQYHGTVIFASQRPLHTIVSRCCPYIDRVVTLDAIPTSFDAHAPLLSLPFILESDEQTIPHEIPYIIPDPTLVEQWRAKLSKDTRFKVGICWQGNSNYSTPFLRAVVAAKSIALRQLAPFGSVTDVSFYSLQKETGVDQLNELPATFKLITFDGDFDQSNGRFMDTAAVIKNLDLVITVDTSIAHLAAAIGTPVWTFIPEPPDWRWMIKRTDTPWYPNMRLFRQKKVGDWDSIIAYTASELQKLISQEQPPAVQHAALPTDTPTEQSTLLEQLRKEQLLLATQFKKRARHLSTLHVSLDSEKFISQLRKLYLLSELQNGIAEKITALEG